MSISSIFSSESGRLMNFMMTKIHSADKVYHLRAKREKAESVGQIAKFNRRYGLEKQENSENSENNQK
ncbi:Ribosomal protein L31 [Corchorus capsularis]|uniref:Ribosomal protein L31 n=1 Tax=Corchorus capsularis TaxID=210143 RepID=A0A1R3ILX4_COCAP|nr:Ribosomal protein L31 [Corchorus capsularis]